MLATLIASFLGGLSINLMPCMLPILPVKLLSLTHLANQNRREQKILGLMNILGSCISFISLALVLTLIRNITGQFFTWGFQMQSPLFIGFLLCILSILCLDAFDLINLKWEKLQNIASSKDNNKTGARFGSFLDGALTAVITSPCSGPVLAGAISISFFMPIYQMILCFATMGIGLAFPFFIITFIPKLNNLIPKPGKWMVYIKKLSGATILILMAWLASFLI